MSHTNSAVADAFVKDLKRSSRSMMASCDSRYPAQNGATFTSNFLPLSYAYSYSTRIATTMQNEHTGAKELWITPSYFSVTTQRHKQHILTAFRAWCAKTGQDYESNVFTTTAAENGRGHLRTTAAYAERGLNAVENTLTEADKPRLREGTRRGVLHSGINALDNVLRNLTLNVPTQHQPLETVQRVRDLHEFMTNTVALPLDEMRASVRAYTTLTTVGND